MVLAALAGALTLVRLRLGSAVEAEPPPTDSIAPVLLSRVVSGVHLLLSVTGVPLERVAKSFLQACLDHAVAKFRVAKRFLQAFLNNLILV